MWTTEQEMRAKAEGWRLATTFNLGDDHPLYDVATASGRFLNDQAAALAVIASAKQGSTFHQQALKLVMSSRVKPTKEKR